MKNVRNLISYIPAITLLAIIMGCLNIYCYFINFDINVLPYLEPFEFIFSFASIMLEVIFSALYLLIIYGIQYVFNLTIVEKTLVKSRVDAITWVLYAIMIVVLIVGGVFYFRGASSGLVASQKMFLFLICVFMPVLLTDIFIISRIKSLLQVRFVLISILGIILVMGYIFVHNLAKRNAFYSVEPKVQVVLQLNTTSEIMTNKDFRFVGNTNKYYFFKNVKSNATTIIPSSEIREVRILVTDNATKSR